MTTAWAIDYKGPFQESGIEGLMVKPAVPNAHSGEICEGAKNKIRHISLKQPGIGRQRMPDRLSVEGVCVSAGSVRNVWIKERTGTHYKPLLRLEDKNADKGLS